MPHDNRKTYIVRAWFDQRDAGHTFGPFDDRTTAEQCVVALAGRAEVKSAKLEEEAN